VTFGRSGPYSELGSPNGAEITGSIHLNSLNPGRRERPIHVTWDDIARIHVVLGISFDSPS